MAEPTPERKSAFVLKAEEGWAVSGSLLTLGLDSEWSRIPKFLKDKMARLVPEEDLVSATMLEFNKALIEATHPFICAVKPNLAYYESQGAQGTKAAGATVEFVHENYPHLSVLADAKRGDIGSTAAQYAEAVFGVLGFDGMTLNPYLGLDSLQPFLDWEDRGCIILTKTSNPSAGDLQDLDVSLTAAQMAEVLPESDRDRVGENWKVSMPVWELMARRTATQWNKNRNCGVVVGATYPAQLVAVRGIVGEMPILVPGIGDQGGEVEAAIRAGGGDRMFVNVSRALDFASSGEDFAEAAAKKAEMYMNLINSYR